MLIIPGRTKAMDGDVLWIATNKDKYGVIKIKIPNDDIRWELYCNNVKITIEIIDDKELKQLIDK